MKNFCFTCPNCNDALFPTPNGYRCEGGHVFDTAKSGYVNLLRPDQKNAKLPGDNKLMVRARKDFLEKGYYAPLATALCTTIQTLLPNGGNLLDAGCGEGYYTDQVATANPLVRILGIDISKFAVDAAAKKNKLVSFAVGSIFHLPIADGSTDVLMTLFAPYCGEEFQRVLKSDGKLVLVIPGARHLMGLKEVLYQHPYANEVKEYALDGFTLLHRQVIDTSITLQNSQDIANLFSMTPYYYKTSAEDAKKLTALDRLETELCFEVLTYQKEGR